jgi:hypothetical protein
MTSICNILFNIIIYASNIQRQTTIGLVPFRQLSALLFCEFHKLSLGVVTKENTSALPKPGLTFPVPSPSTAAPTFAVSTFPFFAKRATTGHTGTKKVTGTFLKIHLLINLILSNSCSSCQRTWIDTVINRLEKHRHTRMTLWDLNWDVLGIIIQLNPCSLMHIHMLAQFNRRRSIPLAVLHLVFSFTMKLIIDIPTGMLRENSQIGCTAIPVLPKLHD